MDTIDNKDLTDEEMKEIIAKCIQDPNYFLTKILNISIPPKVYMMLKGYKEIFI